MRTARPRESESDQQLPEKPHNRNQFDEEPKTLDKLIVQEKGEKKLPEGTKFSPRDNIGGIG